LSSRKKAWIPKGFSAKSVQESRDNIGGGNYSLEGYDANHVTLMAVEAPCSI